MRHHDDSNSPAFQGRQATFAAISRADDVWAVVLGAGADSGAPIGVPPTEKDDSPDVARPDDGPTVDGGKSLLQQALDRLQGLAPPSRSVVVVGSNQRPGAERQLMLYRGVEIVEQPDDLGTGPAVLASLAVVKAKAPGAIVVVMPAGQHLEGVDPFVSCIQKAVVAARGAPAGLAIVGAEPDQPDVEIGWIVPCVDSGGIQFDVGRVDHLVERPKPDRAKKLLEGGALWNTMIVVGSVESFWRQARRYLPSQTLHFDKLVALAQAEAATNASGEGISEVALARIYDSLCPADFGRALLEHAEGLALVNLRHAGWRPRPPGEPASTATHWSVQRVGGEGCGLDGGAHMAGGPHAHNDNDNGRDSYHDTPDHWDKKTARSGALS